MYSRMRFARCQTPITKSVSTITRPIVENTCHNCGRIIARKNVERNSETVVNTIRNKLKQLPQHKQNQEQDHNNMDHRYKNDKKNALEHRLRDNDINHPQR